MLALTSAPYYLGVSVWMYPEFRYFPFTLTSLNFLEPVDPSESSHNVDQERRDESSFPKGTRLITVPLSKYIVII